MISSALMAHGVKVFRHHAKDNSPQGIFCANGQCSQCMVIANGLPVKACMTAVTPDMKILPADGLPVLPQSPPVINPSRYERTIEIEVLIIGAGPSGLSAAIMLGEAGADVL